MPLTAGFVGPAAAQSREVFIGATGPRFERRPEALPERTSPERMLPERMLPERMLEEAALELRRGNVVEARRVLESIIERRPDSRVADEARRILAPIYAGNLDPFPGRARSHESVSTGSRMPVAPELPVAAPVVVPVARSQLPDAPITESRTAPSRQSRALANDFRFAVGDRVFFGEQAIEIGSRSRQVLQAQAQWLARFPNAVVVIEGHADDRGNPDQNAEFASRRAEAVRARLIEEGVAEHRIRIANYGRSRPISPCSDPECAAQNRRVVTVIQEAAGRPIAPARNETLPRAGYGRGERN